MNKVWFLAVSVLAAGVLGGCSDGRIEEQPAERPPSAAGVKPLAADGDHFLFIGNSHTFVNDLPGTFYEMARAGGHSVEVDDVTCGGYSLARFADPHDEYGAQVDRALGEKSWDFVVLQDNTNSAVNGEEAMYPHARELDRRIREAGGKTVFLMTWAPKDGAQGYSREAIQAALAEHYEKIAGELGAPLIPGGKLYAAALAEDPQMELWDEDGQHPSAQGTYLAACGAYALFFGETPQGNGYTGELDQETAEKLQRIAWEYMQGIGLER